MYTPEKPAPMSQQSERKRIPIISETSLCNFHVPAGFSVSVSGGLNNLGDLCSAGSILVMADARE